MPVDIKELTEGWLELESDPGLFTLLLEDFGVKGVQVEEIYDLNKPLDSPVYGFIFLFRWVEERRSRRKVVEQNETFVKDEDIVNNIFFAQQMVPNSCATHALISILLNCPNIHLGETLARLKAHTQGMSPDNKGWAIGNTPELACAHNSHAMPQAKRRLEKGSGVTTGRFTGEAFHFVSFVPIGGRLFELDGLKPYPIDHGPCNDMEWTDKFRSVITDRLGITADEYNEIRFNLMAVVPDRRLAIQHKLKMLRTNKQIVLDALQHLVKIKDKGGGIKNETSMQAGKHSITNNVDESAESTKEEISEEEAKNTKPETSSTTSKVTLCPLDYATPLTIQTSPAPSTSGTDTPSDLGSAFNSPTQTWNWANSAAGQNSPTSKDLKRFVVLRMAEQEDNEKSVSRINTEAPEHKSGRGHARVHTSDGDPVIAEKKNQELLEPHTFAPKDLLALLRNLENEICMCEMSLKDENDKQNKYKVDDSRRTHNYDEFICTFLSMLAEQGKLADLVELNLVVPKRPNNSTPVPKPTKKKKDGGKRKKKGRSKVKKRR
ncbi:ubiquitin carboxyl-terminal hydrolase calypso isoform X1 [Diorhabda carinulata]|uniref:ubiquitin carboxyl-terminal hydrolase calypso isoform X1 n=1 Tax=Diorhabda carinulata TaxID=1163345 RepID=UPI00259FEA19|nr:ubiquitin carboxyl-terminal hydrolase calypso isoform X1 [Diorhabda carinulata]